MFCGTFYAVVNRRRQWLGFITDFTFSDPLSGLMERRSDFNLCPFDNAGLRGGDELLCSSSSMKTPAKLEEGG